MRLRPEHAEANSAVKIETVVSDFLSKESVMIRYIALAVFGLILTGCASTQTKPQRDVLAEAATTFGGGDFIYIDIPSHGAIGDGVAIAAGGGANATRLGGRLGDLSRSGDGKVLVSGRNSALVNAVIKGAVEGKAHPGVWLIYAGDEKYATPLKEVVEGADMRYSFIDIHQ